MKHIKVTLFISLCLCLPNWILAQHRWEIGVFGGVSNYEGDLAPDPVLKESHPAVGIVLKRNANPYFSYTLSANYGSISGNDSNFKSLAPRGLKFDSKIIELSTQIEFNLFKFGTPDVFLAKRFTPYVFTGLSFFHFDPTVTYGGKLYHLQQENTEGEGLGSGSPSEYKLNQLSIPIGGGLKFNLSDRLNLLILASYRATFTSYLDDVGGLYPDKAKLVASKGGDLSAYFSDPTGIGVTGSQRGNPDKLDWYMFYGITLSYIIPGPICPKF